MRMQSPNFMNGVFGEPVSIRSTALRSAMHAHPAPGSAFDIVPPPMIVARNNSRRGFAATRRLPVGTESGVMRAC